MRQWSDLIGQRFGMLVVIAKGEPTTAGRNRWVCKCDCGNEHIAMGYNLKRGTTVSCGCKRHKDLSGQKIGKLTVIGRSDQYGPRGTRRTQLWKCKCECGAITYKATDTLTNPDVSMCQECANKYAATRARENAGYIAGTQISKIFCSNQTSDNATGVRGVYRDGKTGRYRARITFKGKQYNLGTFVSKEDAAKARKKGEEDIFRAFLEIHDISD